MLDRTYAYLFSEDRGKHWRMVALVGEDAKAKIVDGQRAMGNDNKGKYRYRFIEQTGEES